MKQKLMRFVALFLVIASLIPYATAAEPGVNLWCENNNIDVNNIVINVGDTITIGCDASEWATKLNSDSNHTVISALGSGNGINPIREKQDGAGMSVSITGVAAGKATVTFTIQAGFSEHYEYGDTTIDRVFSTTSVTVPITVIGEKEPEIPDIYVEPPTIDIVDADGKVCSGSEVIQKVDDLMQFKVGLNSKYWTTTTVMDKNENRIGVYAYNCQYTDDYTGYVLTNASSIHWSLNANKDEYQLTQNNGAASVLCKKGGASGTLTVLVVVEKVVGGFMTGEYSFVTQQIKLRSEMEETKTLTAGELFEDVDVNKVPNPFVNLSSNAWYYDSFMSLYAWGILDGLDFSEKQDGSMILKMEKTVFDGREEDVSATFVSESEWSAKTLSAAAPTAVANSLSFGPASVRLSANSKSGAFVPPTNQADGRGGLVQKVYNVEKALNGSVGSYIRNPFTDVSSRKAYYDAVLWGADTGVINGYGGGLFGPEDGITREQFCAILYRYAQNNNISFPKTYTAKTFADNNNIGSWAKEAVAACQKAGIVDGYPDGTFRPKSYISLPEAAKMIDNFCCK